MELLNTWRIKFLVAQPKATHNSVNIECINIAIFNFHNDYAMSGYNRGYFFIYVIYRIGSNPCQLVNY